jgi:putative chitinase
MDEAKLRAILEEFVKDLTALLGEVKTEVEPPEDIEHGEVRLGTFFDQVRPMFGGKLSVKQVGGMEAKIEAFIDADLPLSHAAYALATSYHETAKRMQPVREGLSASDAWRKRNLRYYPWYGRGDVQLTWKENYAKADKELGLGGALIDNLDLALDPDISAAIMVRGMEEGWFSGDRIGRHTLIRHLPDEEGTMHQFSQARRIINLMDKAALIAGYAIKFQAALKKAGY